MARSRATPEHVVRQHHGSTTSTSNCGRARLMAFSSPGPSHHSLKIEVVRRHEEQGQEGIRNQGGKSLEMQLCPPNRTNPGTWTHPSLKYRGSRDQDQQRPRAMPCTCGRPPLLCRVIWTIRPQ